MEMRSRNSRLQICTKLLEIYSCLKRAGSERRNQSTKISFYNSTEKLTIAPKMRMLKKQERQQFLNYVKYLLHISTSVWVLRFPNAGLNSHFQHFCTKQLKKARNLQHI